MNIKDVSKQCVDICFTDRGDLVKWCMNNALDKMASGSNDPVPTDSSIFSYLPSKDMYVEYASEIMKSKTDTREIMRVVIASTIDKFAKISRSKRRILLEAEEDQEEPSSSSSTRSKRARLNRGGSKSTPSNAPRNGRNPRNIRSTRSGRPIVTEVVEDPPVVEESSLEQNEENEEDEDDIATDVEESGDNVYSSDESLEVASVPKSSGGGSSSGGSSSVNCHGVYPTLPVPLGHTNSGSMTLVAREYFPDSEFVFPGIYTLPGDTGYILFCVDNGRYSNAWSHNNNVTTLTWVTANKDRSRSALTAIAAAENVYVFRKISGETTFRYMGKVFRSENVNRRVGTVELALC